MKALETHNQLKKEAFEKAKVAFEAQQKEDGVKNLFANTGPQRAKGFGSKGAGKLNAQKKIVPEKVPFSINISSIGASL